MDSLGTLHRMRIVALLTSFNRKDKTLECLARLRAAADRAQVGPLRAILVDDGSTDGTAQAVSAQYPWVKVLRGDGSLFWNRGMHKAMAHALESADFDALLWLNDDTFLYPDALVRMLAAESARTQAKPGRCGVVVVGATADRQTGALTYSGQVKVSHWRPLKFSKVFSATEVVTCDTMNGNVVFLPRLVVMDVGNLDPVFEHAMGDIDYGLRARRRGHDIVVAAGFVGECSNNPIGTHQDHRQPFSQRWRYMLSRKGLPWRSWLQLTRRHGGPAWPAHFVWPYLRLLLSAVPPWKPSRVGRSGH